MGLGFGFCCCCPVCYDEQFTGASLPTDYIEECGSWSANNSGGNSYIYTGDSDATLQIDIESLDCGTTLGLATEQRPIALRAMGTNAGDVLRLWFLPPATAVTCGAFPNSTQLLDFNFGNNTIGYYVVGAGVPALSRECSASLPVGEWAEIMLYFDGGNGTVWINGEIKLPYLGGAQDFHHQGFRIGTGNVAGEVRIDSLRTTKNYNATSGVWTHPGCPLRDGTYWPIGPLLTNRPSLSLAINSAPCAALEGNYEIDPHPTITDVWEYEFPAPVDCGYSADIEKIRLEIDGSTFLGTRFQLTMLDSFGNAITHGFGGGTFFVDYSPIGSDCADTQAVSPTDAAQTYEIEVEYDRP